MLLTDGSVPDWMGQKGKKQKAQFQAANGGTWGWFGKGEPLLVIWKIWVSLKRNYPKKSIEISIQSWGGIQIRSIKFKKKISKGEIYQTVKESPAKSSESRMVWVTSFKCFTWYHIYTVNRKHFHLKNCCYICVSSTLHLKNKRQYSLFHMFYVSCYYFLTIGSTCIAFCMFICFVLFLCRQQTEE